MTANNDNIGRLGDEPTCEVMYLNDGAGPQAKIVGAQRDNVVAAGERFLAASGGDACLLLAGPLVSEAGRDDQSTEGAVARCCAARFGYPGEPFDGTIDLILDTFGGSLDSAFKTMLFVSRFTKRLRVFVPRHAKSAGTLIAIGANDLYMSPFAELGPLDTQIRDPRNPTDRVSALDCYQSVDYVREFGFSTLSQALKQLAAVTQGKLLLTDSLDAAAQFAIGSITPMLSQTRSLDFGAWGRSLKMGERYAQILISRAADVELGQAEKIATRLVYGYTHHYFPIDVTEARDMGLNPREMTEDVYKTAIEIVSTCNDNQICIEFVGERAGSAEENGASADGAVPDAAAVPAPSAG